jgi:hypothetical protein
VKPLKYIFAFAALFTACYAEAQQVRFDNLKEQFGKDKIFGINGGVSANALFYDGNSPAREPFTWVLNGNLTFNIASMFDMPFSFNFNNLGGNYTYPTMPNRFSFHPGYKWFTGHIGDISMSFSPYTLNGHQFTGGGIEVMPDRFPLKVAVMYGRLLKATEYNPEERLSMPAYNRMGYGVKALYDKDKFSFGMSFFSAGDDANSLRVIPDSIDLLPQNNIAMSWEAGLKLIKNLTLTAEYGISLLTRDIRVAAQNPVTYHALRSNLTYRIAKSSFGFGYERIDPNYTSLGAYYFTNDLENFTLNYARPFFNDKLTFALSAGLQHDNLDNNKVEETQRFVGSLTVNYNHSKHLNLAFSYSNFQSYTNIKSQFDYINDITGYGNMDTLNFTQLSQNANLNVNWNFGSEKVRKHIISLNLNYQEAADRHDNTVSTGGMSRFYNLSGNYGLFFIPVNLQLNASANVSYNTIAQNNSLTYGPSLGMTGKFFKKTLTSGVSVSYNISANDDNLQNSFFNIRWNTAYLILKKHNISFALINQHRNIKNRPSSNDFTATVNYTYNF